MTWNDLNALVLRLISRWWVVAIIVTIVLLAAAWRVAATPDRYRTTTLMVVGPNVELEPSEVLRSADLLRHDTVMATYADVMGSPLVVNSAMNSIEPGTAPWDGYSVRIVREPNSNVLRMIVEGPDRDRTAALTDAMRADGPLVLSELFPIYAVSPLYTTGAQPEPVGLPWMRALLLAGIVGLALGTLVALWFDSLMQYRRSSRVAAPPTAGTTVGSRAGGSQVGAVRQP